MTAPHGGVQEHATCDFCGRLKQFLALLPPEKSFIPSPNAGAATVMTGAFASSSIFLSESVTAAYIDNQQAGLTLDMREIFPELSGGTHPPAPPEPPAVPPTRPTGGVSFLRVYSGDQVAG